MTDGRVLVVCDACSTYELVMRHAPAPAAIETSRRPQELSVAEVYRIARGIEAGEWRSVSEAARAIGVKDYNALRMRLREVLPPKRYAAMLAVIHSHAWTRRPVST